MNYADEFSALHSAARDYSREWISLYRSIRKVDLRNAPIEELTALRKECTRTELYARAVSDHVRAFVTSLEGL